MQDLFATKKNACLTTPYGVVVRSATRHEFTRGIKNPRHSPAGNGTITWATSPGRISRRTEKGGGQHGGGWKPQFRHFTDATRTSAVLADQFKIIRPVGKSSYGRYKKRRRKQQCGRRKSPLVQLNIVSVRLVPNRSVQEIIKLGLRRRAIQIRTRDTHKRAREAAVGLMASAFVRYD